MSIGELLARLSLILGVGADDCQLRIAPPKAGGT